MAQLALHKCLLDKIYNWIELRELAETSSAFITKERLVIVTANSNAKSLGTSHNVAKLNIDIPLKDMCVTKLFLVN